MKKTTKKAHLEPLELLNEEESQILDRVKNNKSKNKGTRLALLNKKKLSRLELDEVFIGEDEDEEIV
jgi:hypothetical protein